MAERQFMMGNPSQTLAFSQEEHMNAASVEALDWYLNLAADCVEAVQKMPSPEFNGEQCDHLALKLKEVVESARVLCAKHHEFFSTTEMRSLDVEIFKLLLSLARGIEDFIQGCCNDAWIHAAMILTNVSRDYVSSVAFNLELLKIVFSKERAETRSITLDQVQAIHSAEVGIVEVKAGVDVSTLFDKVALALSSLRGEERALAGCLLQKLKRVEPESGLRELPLLVGSDSISFLEELFKWVRPAVMLGRGPTGSVCEAMWLGNQVAMKTIHARASKDVFIREVELIAGLRHPNITSTFCIQRKRFNCSIVMELMDEDLDIHIHRRRSKKRRDDSLPFNILEAVDLMLQVGEGVNYLHNHQIVHGDLKPNQILVKGVRTRELECGYMTAKVADFGFSRLKQIAANSYSGQTVNTGTIRYRAAEFTNLSSDLEEVEMPFKVDVYSFAMVCYEILTGNKPFQDVESQQDLIPSIMAGKRPILPHFCPPRLNSLIMRCWAPQPRDRPNFAHICVELRHLKSILMMDFSFRRTPRVLFRELLRKRTLSRWNLAPFPELQTGKKLGAGISATVYEVEWEEKKYAKKIYDGLDVPHFENEVRVLEGLDHPNIMSILRSGRERNNCYILMDVMDADLLQHMRRLSYRNGDSPPFTSREAVDIMLQVARGVNYLHENKIVHRDLKAGNILVKHVPRSESEIGLLARVADFGLAIIKENTATNSDQEPNAGTNRWIAPELIKFTSSINEGLLAKLWGNPFRIFLPAKSSKKLPFKSDVYSFAMVCYEILTGTVPFPTMGSANDVKRKVLKGERPDLPDHCPSDLKALIKKCWSHDPRKRPNFVEVCEELQRLKDSLGQ